MKEEKNLLNGVLFGENQSNINMKSRYPSELSYKK
jgi:hypothetical protein